MERVKVLVVEDDPNLGEILHEYLILKGYDAKLARDGEEGEQLFKSEPFELCLLDLMMPKKDGFSLAKDIREINADIPIIFLTAKSMHEDIIQGFTVGADDYITKPFSMEELLMRIKAILKRTKPIKPNQFEEPFQLGKLTYYYSENKLKTPERTIKLTTKENELLKLFCENKNSIVKRKTALDKVWKDDGYFTGRSMDVFMAKIRKYLSDDDNVKILTVHREGFKLVEVG